MKQRSVFNLCFDITLLLSVFALTIAAASDVISFKGPAIEYENGNSATDTSEIWEGVNPRKKLVRTKRELPKYYFVSRPNPSIGGFDAPWITESEQNAQTK